MNRIEKRTLEIIYVISMAVAFSYMFGGEQVTFWYKYLIASFWTIIYFVPKIIRTKVIKGKEATYLKAYILPLIIILLWTLLIWAINPPSGLGASNVTRLFSNILYLALAVMSAIAAVHFFGRKVIKLSVWAIAISILANAIYSIYLYGIRVFLSYLPQAIFSLDFSYGSKLYLFGMAVEVQDATLATGFFILYFVFMDQEDSIKTRIKYILLLLLLSYIGFKRTEYYALIIIAIWILIIKRLKISVKASIYITGIMFFVIGVVYTIIVKNDTFRVLITTIGTDVNGRQNIYRNLSNYYELSLFYIGKGFTYVDKTMYDTTGFASHNTIIRMYAELGAIPCMAWIYWYVVEVPKKILKKYGKEEAFVLLVSTMYLFLAYCIGNAMDFYCIQYCFVLIPIALSKNTVTKKYINNKQHQ